MRVQHRYRHQSITVLVDTPADVVPPHSIQCHLDTGQGKRVLTLTYDGEAPTPCPCWVCNSPVVIDRHGLARTQADAQRIKQAEDKRT
jgi:hypothetical protein